MAVRAIFAGAAALLAGCRSVPDTHFLQDGYAAHAAEIRNAWGPVSQRTGAAVVAKLGREAGEADVLARQLAIEQAVAGTPLVLQNKATLLLDGPATYRAMFSAMRAAQHTINAEFYIIEDDAIGREFADIAIERRKAGVQVNVIYDWIGSLKTKDEYFDRLRAAGVQVVAFNRLGRVPWWHVWKLNHRDHRKQVIVDGRVVFLGGINIDDVYAVSSAHAGPPTGGSSSSGGGSGRGSSSQDQKRSGWRDTDVQIEGPVVADFQRLFLKTWERQHGPPLRAEDYLPVVPPAGSEPVRAIGSTPVDTVSASYLTFMAALTYAQKQAYITNAYFVPDPQLVEALIAAAKRGVDVRLILPSTTDSRSAAYAAHSHYRELLEGGVRIYERQKALLHAKTAVIDGVWCYVGSSNLDWRSAVDNDELNAVILSPEFARAMVRVYALDEAQSDEIRLETWLRRPWRARVKEWFFHLLGRLL